MNAMMANNGAINRVTRRRTTVTLRLYRKPPAPTANRTAAAHEATAPTVSLQGVTAIKAPTIDHAMRPAIAAGILIPTPTIPTIPNNTIPHSATPPKMRAMGSCEPTMQKPKPSDHNAQNCAARRLWSRRRMERSNSAGPGARSNAAMLVRQQVALKSGQNASWSAPPKKFLAIGLGKTAPTCISFIQPDQSGFQINVFGFFAPG
jgi:hypothetical protein